MWMTPKKEKYGSKYMSTRKKSRLLLIKVRTKKIVFPIPLSLFVLEDFVESCSDLLQLGKLFTRGSTKFLVGAALNTIDAGMQELTCGGRWQMADIQTEDFKISINFY